MKPAREGQRDKTLRQLAAEYQRKQERQLNRPSAWTDTEIMGRQRLSRRKKSREWITLYQRSGISLQMNPTYYDFRLWLFSSYGNVSLDLDIEKKNQIARALGIYRFLISNVPSHGAAVRLPSSAKIQVRYSRGDKKRLATAIDRFVSGGRKRRPLP